MLQSQHPKCGGNLELDKFSCFTKHLAYLGIRELFLCSKNSLSAQMLQSQHPKFAGNWELELFWHLAYLAIRKYNAPDKMLCSSAKICIQTCWLLIVAKVLDQTDLILAKNQKSIQGKIQEASRNYPYENCSFQMPQKPKAKCVFGNAYLLSFWFFCTTCLFTQPLFSDPIFWNFLLPSW